MNYTKNLLLNSEVDYLSYALIGVIIFFFAIAFIVNLALFVNEFVPKLKHINSEIKRSRGKEKRFWKRKRRRLWLSLLPFFTNR